MKKKDGPVMGTSFSAMLEEKAGGSSVDPSQAEPVVIEDIEILFSFVEESQDHLETIEEKILKLESSRESEVVDEIFRSMHTMKGTSSFFGFDHIKILSHSLESLLDDIRSDRIGLSQRLIDVLLAGTDMLTHMIGELQAVATEHQDTRGEIAVPPPSVNPLPILEEVDALRSGEEAETGTESRTSQGSPDGEAAEDQTGPDASDRDAEESAAPEPLVTDEIRESFIAESQDLLDAAEELVLELEKSPEDTSPLDGAFRCVHTLKGNAGFLGFAALETACMDLEGVLDDLRTHTKRVNQSSIGTILGSIDAIRELLTADPEELQGGPEEATEGEDEYKPLGSILVDMGATTQDEIDSALNQQERKLGEILVDQGRVSPDAVEQALTSQKTSKSAAPKQVERKDIRVDMSKLDKLFDLMGELITAEAMVIHNPELEGLDLDRFSTATNYLSKITREMQEITMSVRMIPLEGLFNKMRRLVRDLSKRFDKELDFSVSGQDTEMDRNVIEEIADPLMHIIRNAIDHGIEPKETRRKTGKPEVGSLSLGARYEGNEIWISIVDDGAGLSRERILEKAAERGLLKQEAELLRDEEVWQLVFEPGFSTAAQVSEVSGRGVGMDVVKKNVEKLRGKIDIHSEAGVGTTITLKIPLTLAIIDGITARVGSVLYALPMNDILEFHKATTEQITRTDTTREVLRLREEIIPVVKLKSFFGSNNGEANVEEGILIITHRNGRKAALLVDEVEGYQQIVVKALPEYMGVMRAISGCSILGNGDVTLIVDVGSLLKEEFDG